MNTKTVSAVVLTASDGMTITNPDNSILSKEVWLGCEDASENYHEITDAQAFELRKKQREKEGRKREQRKSR